MSKKKILIGVFITLIALLVGLGALVTNESKKAETKQLLIQDLKPNTHKQGW